MGEAVLHVVATPIGHLRDMVPRAIETLQNVKLVAAEDTRHSRKLFEHLGIDTPLVAYHDHSHERVLPKLLKVLADGDSVALISDAGTPLVSDPGYRLVDAVHRAGFAVSPVPGACAAIAALSVAGLATDRFHFEGFLPAKSKARRDRIALVGQYACTVVFYEAPHRLLESLQDLEAVLGGERRITLARELTKHFETVRRDSLSELVAWVAEDSNQQRGECVLVLEGWVAPDEDEPELLSQQWLIALREHLPLKTAAGIVAKQTGERKNRLYQWGLAHLSGSDD